MDHSDTDACWFTGQTILAVVDSVSYVGISSNMDENSMKILVLPSIKALNSCKMGWSSVGFCSTCCSGLDLSVSALDRYVP